MGNAITLYCKTWVHKALEKERNRLGLDSKPIVASRILENYFKQHRVQEEEE